MPATLLILIALIWLPILLIVAYEVLWDLKIWQSNNYSLRRIAHALRWDFSASHRDANRTVMKFVLGLGLGIYLFSPGSPIIALFLILIYSLWINDALVAFQKIMRNQVPYLEPHFRITLIYTLLTLIFALLAILTGSFALYFAASIDYNFVPGSVTGLIPSWAYSMLILIFLSGLVLDLGSPIVTAFLVFITKPEQWAVTQFFKFRARRKLQAYPNLAVVLIAGSYGKTSIKNLTANLLREEFKIVKLREEESLVGIAKDITHNVTADTQVYICDANELAPYELVQIVKFLQPHILGLTGIDESYLGIYRSKEAIIRSYQKALMALPAGATNIINGSDELLRDLTRRNNGKEVLYFPDMRSMDIEDNLLEAETLHIADLQTKSGSPTTYVLLQFQAHSLPLELPSRYAHFLPSILPAILIAGELGIAADRLLNELPEKLNVLSDLEEIGGDNDSVILYHPARSTLDNLELSIARVAKYSGDKYLITAGVHGLGRQKKALYRDLASTIHQHIDVLITFDRTLASVVRHDNHKTEVSLVSSVDELLYTISTHLEPGDVLLIHGPMDPVVLEALRAES